MVTIVLPPELEKTITVRALRNGTTPELLVLATLHQEFDSEPVDDIQKGSLADFLGDFLGCLDSGEIVPGGAPMSENMGEQFAEGMAEKHKAGKL